MKTKVLFLFLFVLISVNGFSQFLKFGVRAALTSSTLMGSDITSSGANGIKVETLKNAKFGFQGGVTARITLAGVYIQPEMLLSSTAGEMRLTDASNNVQTIKQSFTKLDIPVLIGPKFGPLRLGVGPVASVILSKPSESLDFSSQSIKTKFNNMTIGYQLNLGLDLGKKIALDVKYEGNLSKLGNGVNIGGTSYNFDSRNNQLIFGLALFF